MTDENKTKKQLLEALNELRDQNVGLETLLHIAHSIIDSPDLNYSGVYFINDLQTHLNSPHLFLEIIEPGVEFSWREGVFKE